MCFLFFKHKTAYEMRISDWSSDVCSSDLMAVTNDPAIAQRLALIRSHGITRDPELMSQTPDGPWYYEQVELGYNYRMTDVQAALGSSQMSRLEEFVARRHA